jgi:hypothetical protein
MKNKIIQYSFVLLLFFSKQFEDINFRFLHNHLIGE